MKNWTPVRKAARDLLAAMAYTEKMTRAAKEYVKMDEDGNIDFSRGIGAALCCGLEWAVEKM